MVEYKYKAFISYNHNERDSDVAQALHSRIESYTVPRRLRNNGEKKLGKVFRDQEELSVSNDLNQHILDALDESEFLIVICSPGAVASKWVSKEITYFLEHHEQKKLLTVLTDGDREDINKKLLLGQPEPHALELTGIADEEICRKLKERFLKLCAPLLGCDYDDLVRRDQKRQRRIFRGWLAGITAVAAVIIGILLWSNWQIEGKNRELEQSNQALEQQINERLLRESELLTQKSVQALAYGDQHTAIRSAVDALPSPDSPRPYYAPAEQALCDALDIFNLGMLNYVLHDTVLEHTAAVVDLCFSSDGLKLFTATSGGSVSCFDVASGTLLWRRTPTSSFSDLPCLYLAESQGSILAVSSSSICSLDIESGETLWELEDQGYPEEVALSDDGSRLACLSEDTDTGIALLNCIATADGSILRAFPVDTCEWFDGGITMDVCDFSSDGRYFTGCYMNDSGETIFLADVTTGDIRFLPLGEFEGSMRLCSVEFTDQDRTVTVIHYEYNSDFFYHVQKLRVSDGKLLWQTETPEQDFDYYVFRWDYTDWLHREDHLLLGIQHQLYALNMDTGELFDTEHLPSRLRCLQMLDQDSFALVLEDGTYRTGEVSDGDLRLHESTSNAYDQTTMMNLGPNLKACLGKKGYLRGGDTDAQTISVISSDDRGFFSAAFVPQDNDWQVILREAVPFDPPLEKKNLYVFDLSGYNYFVLGYLGTDTLCLYDPYDRDKTLLFDRMTLERIDQKPGDIQFTYNNFTSQPELHEDYSILLADNSVLTVTPTEYGIRLLLNGRHLPDATYPDAVPGVEPYDVVRSLSFGRNGYILLDKQTTLGPCLAYDIRTQKWYTVPVQVGASDENLTCLGETEPTFTVMDQTGILRTYDIPSGEEIRCVDTGLQHNDFLSIQWIMDDKYLLANTNDLQYFFLDGVTGEVLFRYTAKTDNLAYFPNYISDPQRGYFFIWDDIGVCIDTKNWAVRHEIPKMELYDPLSGMLFYQDTTSNTGFTEYICAIRLPSTEELVAIAKAYLGE